MKFADYLERDEMKRKYSARSLRNLEGIHPDLRRVVDRALQESPLDFVVTEGLRTLERQKHLVSTGASGTLNSRHLTGHAIDFAVLDGGKVVWDWPLYAKVGEAFKEVAEAEGVEIVWGGDWKTLRDGPHIELDRRAYPEHEWTTDAKAPASPYGQEVNQPVATAGVAAGGAGIAAALQHAPTFGGVVGQLVPAAQVIAVIVAAAAVGWLLWKRSR